MTDLERDSVLMAVAHSLPEDVTASILEAVGNRWPHLHGAEAADVLDYADDFDHFTSVTDPFFEKFGGQLSDSSWGNRFASFAILLAGRKLTSARVWCYLQRAGAVDAPKWTDVEVGIVVPANDVHPAPHDANHLYVRSGAEQGMRAAGLPEAEITEFRAYVRKTGPAGFSYNVADIARWVTLVDRIVPLPRAHYDPVHDLAVVLAWVRRFGRGEETLTDYSAGSASTAVRNLASHLSLVSPETAEADLRAYFGGRFTPGAPTSERAWT